MLIKYNRDINTRQHVYVVCTNEGVAKFETTDIFFAIKKVQGKA